jgi:hypothetical protein
MSKAISNDSDANRRPKRDNGLPGAQFCVPQQLPSLIGAPFPNVDLEAGFFSTLPTMAPSLLQKRGQASQGGHGLSCGAREVASCG